MPLYKSHRVIESVLNECLGLYNKPNVEVYPGHKLTGPKEEEEEEEEIVHHVGSYCTDMSTSVSKEPVASIC